MAETLGVALTKCYYCGGDSDILMNTRLTERMAEKVKDTHGKVVSMQPCRKCEGYMKDGIILLTIDDEKSEEGWAHPGEGKIPNPWRTGGFFVVREAAMDRLLQEPLRSQVKKCRWTFIEEKIARAIGLYSIPPVSPEAPAAS